MGSDRHEFYSEKFVTGVCRRAQRTEKRGSLGALDARCDAMSEKQCVSMRCWKMSLMASVGSYVCSYRPRERGTLLYSSSAAGGRSDHLPCHS